MCLARVFLKEGDTETMVVKNVTSLKIEGTKISIETLMDEVSEINGTLVAVNFDKSSVTIKAI